MTVLFLVAILVLLPAAIAFLARDARSPAFSVGTPVVYCQDKVATHLISDAYDLHPSERGEFYYYSILSYLRVIEVLGDGRIVAIARNHKRLCFWPNDSSLRKARLTERLLHPFRFPHL